jgi:anhydro-N-acetylmuramic acid kinase
MSGSSLDGLDVAACHFQNHGSRWDYQIACAETLTYPPGMRRRLKDIGKMSGEELARLDADLGVFFGKAIGGFIQRHGIARPDYIASHGHTACHNPSAGYTLQIGNGAAIAAHTRIPTIADFRSLDVALGGQGAPLVPIGDELLFAEYECCLNLGGYGNISYRDKDGRRAFDTCPVNKPINLLAEHAGEEMDRDGSMARRGRVIPPMLESLNTLEYYQAPPPKSLGDTWFDHTFRPVLDQWEERPLHDRMRTVCEHIAIQVARSTDWIKSGRILATGGGAHNNFLMERLQQNNHLQIVKPADQLVDFKEALVFALMGALRSRRQVNCLASATGASNDSSGGVIYHI